MKKFIYVKNLLCMIIIFVCVITSIGCNSNNDRPDNNLNDLIDDPVDDSGDKTVVDPFEGIEEVIDNVIITYGSGSTNCYTIDNGTITFSNITENSVYAISGTFNGNIVIDVTDDYEFELDLEGLTLSSELESPIIILSGDKVTISAKKGTENFIYDKRIDLGEDDYSASIYALCDLDVQGKGSLKIISKNNGIHTKDDLEVKNLTLYIDCMDNCLKGNDSVTILSGTYTLIARIGDGIKTTNSDISSKGNQRGTITISGGDLQIYAACDGIDASYNALINEESSSVNLNIDTDKYSPYSEEVTITKEDTYYIRFNNKLYDYALKYMDDSGNTCFEVATYDSMLNVRGGTYYFYKVNKPNEYNSFELFIYNSGTIITENSTYLAKSSVKSINNSYDTISINYFGTGVGISFTNYTTNQGGFGPNMNEGNNDKGDYSTKGIKADNEIIINEGIINIKTYDDAIHANNDVALENSTNPLGNVTINNGTITISSNDDGIHGDCLVTINGGVIVINNSYEGIEGENVIINNGNITVISKDDGINGTNTIGEAIVIAGGILYIYAKGDGIDSNSQSSYDGILISGGQSVIISSSNANSSIDSEKGYKYTSGVVIGISMGGGMSTETIKCSNFSSIGKYTNISLSINSSLLISINDEIVAGVTPPANISNALVFYLGSNQTTFRTGEIPFEVDSNKVYFK